MSETKNFLGPETATILKDFDLADVEILHDWAQLGSETFLVDFLIHSVDHLDLHLIAKSCIKFFPVETMDDWMRRRELLEKAGVSVPKVVVRDRAMIVEEHIPYAFKEAYAEASVERRELLQQNFITTYKRVAGAGFWPISLHDARSRGDDVVLIDMGEDIGSPKDIDRCHVSVGAYALQAFHRISHKKLG
jgi:hypothetical protein